MQRTIAIYTMSLACLAGACSEGMGGEAGGGSPTAGMETAGSTGESTGDTDGSGTDGSGGQGTGGGTGTGGGVCGDGVLDPGEACDDGNNQDGDGCQADCTLPPPGCGDGTLDPGEFCHALETVRAVDFTPTGIAAADLDADGQVDLVVSDLEGHAVHRWALDAEGTAVESEKTHPSGTSPLELRLLDADDVEGLDLFVLREGTEAWGLSALQGLAGGLFAAETEVAPDAVLAFDAGHYDLDGAPDLIVSVTQFLTDPLLLVVTNLDLGDVNLTSQMAGGINAHDEIPYACLADLDGDGREDVAFVTTDEATEVSSFYVARSNPGYQDQDNLGFDPPVKLGSFPEAVGAHCEDLDANGLEDFVVAHGDGSVTTVFMGAGLAVDRFAYSQLGAAAVALATGDVDADGRPELVAGDADGTVHFLDVEGLGDPVEVFTVDVGEAPAQLALADAGQDGIDDVYVALPTTRSVAVLRARP